MAIKWLMFDADNTLLDFKKACKVALWKTFEDHGYACSDEIEALYSKINANIWHEFELGKINSTQLRIQRFALLFESLEIQPSGAFEFNAKYLQNLVISSEIYPGVEELLQELKLDFHLSLITNGLKEVQRPRLTRLGMTKYFDSIVVSDEIGVAKPAAEFFEHVYASMPGNIPKNEVLVIGDNIKADIGGGASFGFNTCWISHGKSNGSEIRPDYEIEHIDDFHNVVTSINGN